MAIFSEVKKVDESEQEVRYSFSNGIDAERFLILDKINEKLHPEDGIENVVYRAVARKIATAWIREGKAPERLTVNS
ncbi:hypothetical protein AB0M57_19855 [Streptomyces sp. NPDC051597]|uniref:hypothetical protein n=1 Tax=Streptomyces sp. NPDC051597 TaxID=3155049 RepID=UPI003414968F